ncbi:hypothetical protein ACWDUD_29225 [Rhodococcus sp. NPDC003382]|uniref:hypothetical protein n=1 Tax=unclassified Rhodococcus (in: high G+C Gram-positive bacteria) TaxID=192944 RepID=UPI0018CFEC6F|nr:MULTISPECIES: hypothetical protein [unclassified Rhodococcus (in: high G+C Gram-positive bacteria)]MBH0123027.1 hypothetical protein [Rhodococcus sp. CX]MCK8669907.1 hypothetical protein [Rhodococcus sp. HM1]
MKLNLFVAWAGYTLGLLAIACLALFLLAAGYGHTGPAIVAGISTLVVAGIAMAMIGGTIHHDHKVHRVTPKLF